MVRLEPKPRPTRQRSKQLLKLQTRDSLDLSPVTKQLVNEARATNFGKVKTVKQIVPKKTKTEEFLEAKERLMDAVPSKREQRLIDFHLQRAVELETEGNGTEAAFYREQAETIRRNGMVIREVFAEHAAKHEKEISKNLSKPIEEIRAERKAKEAAQANKMKALFQKQKNKKGAT